MMNHGDPGVFLEILEQIHDLRLDADIERGGWFVEDEQIGFMISAVAMRARCRWPPLSSCA